MVSRGLEGSQEAVIQCADSTRLRAAPQVEMLSSRRRAEQRRREHQLVILRRRQAAWEERQRQLQKGVVVEYEGFRKEPRPRRVRKVSSWRLRPDPAPSAHARGVAIAR